MVPVACLHMACCGMARAVAHVPSLPLEHASLAAQHSTDITPEAPVAADVSLEVVPGAVAQLGNAADNEAVLLLCVCLALVAAIGNLQQGGQGRMALDCSQQLLSLCHTCGCEGWICVATALHTPHASWDRGVVQQQSTIIVRS